MPKTKKFINPCSNQESSGHLFSLKFVKHTLVVSCDVNVCTFSWASINSRRSFRISCACFSSADEYKLEVVETNETDDP